MARANRNLGTEQPIPTIAGFNPGGDDFGVIRQIDGHGPFELGCDGANVHAPSAGDPMWHESVSVYEYESMESDTEAD